MIEEAKTQKDKSGRKKETPIARRVALYGCILALGLVLGYVESLLPALIAVPGVKLGLGNLAVIFSMYVVGPAGAFGVNTARILLSGVLFGNGSSILYSLAGGILSFGVMYIAKEKFKFSVYTVSILGGIFHNVGQLAVAVLVTGTESIWWYMAVLWISGLAAGGVIGFLGSILIKRLRRIVNE